MNYAVEPMPGERVELRAAWRRGDTAALEGVPHAANPGDGLAATYWDLGYRGFPLPTE